MINKADRINNSKIRKVMKKISLILSVICCNIFIATSLANAATLQSVDYSSLQRNKVKVTLTFSEQVTKPTVFSIDEPARLVLDFQGVINKLEQKTVAVKLGAIESISTVEAGGRTRTVINLNNAVPYSLEQEGNTVVVVLDGSSNNDQIVSKDNKASGHSIVDIDFRRGEQGEARLMVYLDQQDSNVNVHQERDTIVVDLMGIQIPQTLQRRLDVIDFATPVTTIDSVQQPRGAQITLSTTGGYFEHLAYQTDSMLVVEIKAIDTEEDEQYGRKKIYNGDKLSLNFQNIEVRAVLQLLADFTGLNLVTSDTVQGSLTLRLKNVPWDQALDIILKTKGLALRQNGTVMFIAPSTEITAREKQELEAKKQLIELEPLYSEIVEINFAKATEILGILDGDADGEDEARFLSERGTVIADSRTNSLLIRDTAEKLDEIRALVVSLDVPVRQVLIEARIVIASNDFTKELGVRFGVTGADFSRDGSKEAITSGSLNATRQIHNGDDLELLDSLNVNLPVSPDKIMGSIGLALAKLPFGGLLELELSAMQEEGHGEVISSPRVITSNQQTAIIEQGTEIPYQEASSSGATSVSFKKAVLKLEVTPQVTPDDRIIMDLEINKDAVGERYLSIPSIDTKSIKTQVLVDNGETVVLGGIYEQDIIEGVSKVPWFGDLPVVGWLFKRTIDTDKKRELLVFITPKIIKEDLDLVDY